MGDSISSYHDDENERIERERAFKFNSTKARHLSNVTIAADDLERFVNSDPALKELQWSYLRNALKLLRELLEGKDVNNKSKSRL